MESDEEHRSAPTTETRPVLFNSDSENEKFTWTAAAEKGVRRKLDVYILPWLFLLWFFAFLDRGNIVPADLDGLGKEVDLLGTHLNTAITLFHVLYILIDIPSNWILKSVGGGRYLAFVAVCWGVISTCMGTVTNFGGLVACRILLGAFQGAFNGGVVVYLSLFYRGNERTARVGVLASAAPLSGAFSGLIAEGLAKLQFGNYLGWPWIFFVEGAVTTTVALTALFFLPDTPSSARFLTTKERWIAAQRVFLDSKGTISERVEQEKFSREKVRLALANINTLLMTWTYFLILIPVYSFAIFLPAILEGLHYDGTKALLFTMPPNLVGFAFVLIATFLGNYLRMRGPLIAVGICVAITGYIMQIASSTPSVQYAGVFFISAGVYPCVPLILTWLANNLSPYYTKATGLGFATSMGQIAAIIATYTYLQQDAPHYNIGHGISLGALMLALITVLANIFYIRHENAARKAGKRNDRYQLVHEGQELGFRHPEFRYSL